MQSSHSASWLYSVSPGWRINPKMTIKELIDTLQEIIDKGCKPDTPVVNCDDRGLHLYTYNPIIGVVKTQTRTPLVCIDTSGEEKCLAKFDGVVYIDN